MSSVKHDRHRRTNDLQRRDPNGLSVVCGVSVSIQGDPSLASCHVMSCHVMPCHAMLCYAMRCKKGEGKIGSGNEREGGTERDGVKGLVWRKMTTTTQIEKKTVCVRESGE